MRFHLPAQIVEARVHEVFNRFFSNDIDTLSVRLEPNGRVYKVTRLKKD